MARAQAHIAFLPGQLGLPSSHVEPTRRARTGAAAATCPWLCDPGQTSARISIRKEQNIRPSMGPSCAGVLAPISHPRAGGAWVAEQAWLSYCPVVSWLDVDPTGSSQQSSWHGEFPFHQGGFPVVTASPLGSWGGVRSHLAAVPGRQKAQAWCRLRALDVGGAGRALALQVHPVHPQGQPR